jgi:purine-binding chemotaxis protein CheW
VKTDSLQSHFPERQVTHWVVFSLAGRRHALSLATVERIVRAAEITPLPAAPSVVLGAIDVQGHVLPVFSLRRRLRLPERTITPADHFIIARTSARTVILVVDSAECVLEVPTASLIDSARIAHDLEPIAGVIQLQDDLVLIHNLELFLSPGETIRLDEAMNPSTALEAR